MQPPIDPNDLGKMSDGYLTHLMQGHFYAGRIRSARMIRMILCARQQAPPLTPSWPWDTSDPDNWHGEDVEDERDEPLES